ncbi:glutamate synthase subunit beta [Bacillus sp. FJAT-49736]|uniref:glutamate synthase subunit beta n=1 Tax=Bacillus sp. FJAT-49736 TaxID=2833582 RepID=UPI001BCA0A87|nr:glutamate synthase subunit beta [Bacillus sp. FJAT-49736]MBS4175165.1 glutamate synthase subunit beta [Bacillus sp. FJAT-49736]
MGHLTGFIDIQREKTAEQHPLERIQHWQEYQKTPSEEAIKLQASRCMDCGIPFCQMGAVIRNQTSGCPLYNLIPEWNELVYQGKWLEAYQRLAKTNNFPEFTSRACPAPCEGSCTAGVPTQPVAIKSIEKAIIDKAFEEGWVKARIPAIRTGKKVAVIGSGPAGLTAADDLNQLGHQVTIFEKDDRFGGLLMYGIPNMKIDKKYVDRRIDILQNEGIQFQANTNVGVDITLEEIQKVYNAVLICTGADKPRELPIPGRNLKGIYPAMEYLKESTKHYLDNQYSPAITAKNKKVIVIGGGDTGADCVATAIRQGCKSVVQFGKHGKLPNVRSENNPWPENPQIFTLEYAYEEAESIFGEDPRQYYIQTNAFLGDADGNVNSLETTSFLEENKNELRYWDADIIFIAIGFEGVNNTLFPTIVKNKNKISANDSNFKTNQDGIFAAGDARRGQSLIVWAMQEGKKAAQEINNYLGNKK